MEASRQTFIPVSYTHLDVYKRQVGTLGSIRSARTYYLELALGHDALLVHAGGSPDAYSKISAWDVDNMDGVNGGSDAKIFWRDPERRKTMSYEHCLVTSGESILDYLAQGHFETAHAAGYTDGQLFTADGLSLIHISSKVTRSRIFSPSSVRR